MTAAHVAAAPLAVAAALAVAAGHAVAASCPCWPNSFPFTLSPIPNVMKILENRDGGHEDSGEDSQGAE